MDDIKQIPRQLSISKKNHFFDINNLYLQSQNSLLMLKTLKFIKMKTCSTLELFRWQDYNIANA